MSFYKTQIRSVSNGVAVDVTGKSLTFAGNLSCQAGDTVWTDGAVIFGNSPIKPVPLIFDNPSGIPVISDNLRGYFDIHGNFKNYRIADDNWLANSDSVFKHGSENLFDAEISSDSSLFTISATNDCVYFSLDDTIISDSNVYIKKDETQIAALNSSFCFNAEIYDETIEDLFQNIVDGISLKIIRNGEEADSQIIKFKIFDYTNYTKIAQLLNGKIDTKGNYKLLFGSYTRADFLFHHNAFSSVTYPSDTEVKFEETELDISHISSSVSSDTFITGFKPKFYYRYSRDDFINDSDLGLIDWNFAKRKYTEDNHYLDAEILPSEDNLNTYSRLIDFRKNTNDNRLRKALIALLEECVGVTFSTVEVEEYEPIFNSGTNISNIPSFQAIAYNLIDNINSENTLFYTYDAEDDVRTYSLSKGARWHYDTADGYEVMINKIYKQTPPEDERIPATLYPLLRGVYIYAESEEVIRAPVGAVAFFDSLPHDIDNSDNLNGRFAVTNTWSHTFPTGIITYKLYPLYYGVGNMFVGVVYIFYWSYPKDYFNQIYTIGEPTTHFVFRDTNQNLYDCWFTRNATTFHYGIYHDRTEKKYFSFPVQDDYSLEFNIAGNGKISSEGIFKDYDFVADSPEQSCYVPNNGFFHKLDNLSIAPLGKDADYGYLIGSYGNGLYKFDNDSLNKLDDGLKNFRLRFMKNISKAKR